MHPIVTQPANIRFVTGVLSRTRAYELEKSDPNFPRRVRIGSSTGWLTSELQAYLAKKVEQSATPDTLQAA